MSASEPGNGDDESPRAVEDPQEAKTIQLNIAAPAVRELVKIAIRQIIDQGDAGDGVRIERPLPFSRAAGEDFFALLEMWRAHMPGRIEELEPRDCPACAGDRRMRLFYSYDNYPYAACLDCGTWYVPHRVTDAVIEDFLSKVPEARIIADRMMRGRDEGSRTADRARFTRYFEMLRPLLRGHRATRYLDIGCGVGHSIEVAGELGMRATGVELSEVAVRTARAKGRNVLLPAEQDAGATYELISLFETLEHIADPGETLSAAKASLATGGAIFVTVPNRACWEISSLRERCFHVYGGTDGAGHINLFDVDGLGRLFSRHGLSLVYADSEYGSDALQVFGQFLKARKPVPDMVGQAPVGLQLPDTMFTLLNATGPALSLLERVLIRSPILIAIACRQEDVERLQPVITEMEASRRARLLELLDSV